jgi:uncharacterized alkaline shock family protein YloU
VADAAPAGAGDRHADAGTLVIKDKVVQRVAVRAALDTPGVAPHAAGIDKLTGRSLPRAQVYLSATRVRAHLDLAVTWPHSLSGVGSAVQRNVAAALQDGVGMTVDGVDVAIEAIVTEAAAPSRDLQ